MEQHTKGPWKIFNVYAQPEIRDANCKLVVQCADYDIANARRIVACVNACDGVGTELLENNPAPFSELRKQRDILLAALERIVTDLSNDDDEGLIEHTEQMIQARDAIAMVRKWQN